MSDEATPVAEEKPAEKTVEEKNLEELLAAIPKYPVRTLEEKAAQLTEPPPEDPFKPKAYWPGHVNYYGERGTYAGGKMVRLNPYHGGIPDVEEFNKFFADNPKALCCYHEVLPSGHILFIYTNRLDPEEQQEFDEFQREVEGKMVDWRAAKKADKRKSDQEKLLAWNELVRRAQVGDRYEREVQPNLKKAKKGGKK